MLETVRPDLSIIVPCCFSLVVLCKLQSLLALPFQEIEVQAESLLVALGIRELDNLFTPPWMCQFVFETSCLLAFDKWLLRFSTQKASPDSNTSPVQSRRRSSLGRWGPSRSGCSLGKSP